MKDNAGYLEVTEIGEFIRQGGCARRFKLRHEPDLAKLPFADRLFNPLDLVLQHVAREREAGWERALQQAGCATLAAPGEKGVPWEEFAASLRELPVGQPAYCREVQIAAQVSAFPLRGRMDFVVVRWVGERPRVRIVEGKASRRDRTYHRLQVTAYRMMFQTLMEQQPVVVGGTALRPEDLECVVARIDKATNASQDILSLPPLDTWQEEGDLARLLAPDGPLDRILSADLADLEFEIGPRCDNCSYDWQCLTESARQRRLELLALFGSTNRALHRGGITNLDPVADLDLEGPLAKALAALPGLAGNPAVLKARAQARRATLPSRNGEARGFPVVRLPHSGFGQLPAHEQDGRRLVRAYLVVTYDYPDNRLVALAAHVTDSARRLQPVFRPGPDGRPMPVPEVCEEPYPDDADQTAARAVVGQDIVEWMREPWSGDYEQDTGRERVLLETFIARLTKAMQAVAGGEEAPIHFYVWARSEMDHLLESCTRIGVGAVRHLHELLGCREPLEQLIFSCVREEVDSRFALGWTGRGLLVAASLPWFGRRYHWHRIVNGQAVALDTVFSQDLFDFRQRLELDAAGGWHDRRTGKQAAASHQFEIHSRFFDGLTAPYWHAQWGELQGVECRDARVRRVMDRYLAAAQPGYLEAFLTAQAHALRFLEENLPKSREIKKPTVPLQITDFTLGVNRVVQASLDFLRLDQHVRLRDWIAGRLEPPIYRVASGRTLPLKGIRLVSGNTLDAALDTEGYDIAYETLRDGCALREGDMVRLTPLGVDRDGQLSPCAGQRLGQLLYGGSTCKILALDWERRQVRLQVLPQRDGNRYRLKSVAYRSQDAVPTRATLDESPSDFVAHRVEERLVALRGHHACDWFDPDAPAVPPQTPLSEDRAVQCEQMLDALEPKPGRGLHPSQKRAILDGMNATVSLTQGPPGTGKTTTAAAGACARISARRSVGDIVLVAAQTHRAANELLQDLAAAVESAQAQALPLPPIHIAKALKGQPSSGDPRLPKGNIPLINPAAPVRDVQAHRNGGVLVIGGTTSALLEMAGNLDKSARFGGVPSGFQVPLLLVDEASMMGFPHLLALLTLLRGDGEVQVSGDHRQLAQILAQAWEREKRPPTVHYRPFLSAYDMIRAMAEKLPRAAVWLSALNHTFRLPPGIRALIAPLYAGDGIALAGDARDRQDPPTEPPAAGWEAIWGDPADVFLVVHSEAESVRSNPLEARVIEEILDAHPGAPSGSVAVVTPHCAQRSLLRRLLKGTGDARPAVDVIDTADSLQGGQRDTVIVSGTTSDPAALVTGAEFRLNPNRWNVAFTRAQSRLVVVCSESWLCHIPPEAEQYEGLALWKALPCQCARLIANQVVDGHTVRVFAG